MAAIPRILQRQVCPTFPYANLPRKKKGGWGGGDNPTLLGCSAPPRFLSNCLSSVKSCSRSQAT